MTYPLHAIGRRNALPTSPTFSAAEHRALTENGWTVFPRVALRTWRFDIVATLHPACTWRVARTGVTVKEGTEATLAASALLANDIASGAEQAAQDLLDRALARMPRGHLDIVT